MANQSTNSGAFGIKASTNSNSGARKFTLSCSRCRVSKLKCDKNEPCLECVKRQVGHLCSKDERQPRAKRAKTDQQPSNNDIVTDESQNRVTEAEEATEILEHFVDGSSWSNVYPSAASETAPSVMAPDYPHTYWLTAYDPRRQGEKFELLREIVHALPNLDVIRLLYQVFVTRCQGPLGNVVHTPTFLREAERFHGCLGLASPEAQVTALSQTISMDTLACHILALVLGLAFHPTPFLHGWVSTPLTLHVEELRASDVSARMWKSLAMRCLQGEGSLFCGSIPSLQAVIMLLLDGQEGPLALDAILVTAISGAQKLGLHRLGDARLEASIMPMPCSEDGSSVSTDPPRIRTEIGVRIWWALVMRDWSRGQALGYYSIHPSHFKTRVPLHINDDDLCPPTLKVDINGYITERPRSEFTMLSYTVHALQIARFARESIDLRGPLRQTQRQEEKNKAASMRNHLNKKYENFVAQLPSHFKPGSTLGLNVTEGPMAAIPIHRWMLHQQLWSLFLRLHRASLFAPQDARAPCQLLAQNIISTQAQIQARCAVCGSLSTSVTQLFNAAVVLLVDLLFSSKPKGADHSSAQLRRLMTKDKIREAVELLRTQSATEGSSSPREPHSQRVKASAQRSAVALNALMELEEEEYGTSEDSNGADPAANRHEGQAVLTNSNAIRSLKHKVINTLEALRGNAKTADEATEQANPNSSSAPNTPWSLPTATNGFHDLDILPVLSHEPNSDFWQFLGLAPPPVQWPELEDPFGTTL